MGKWLRGANKIRQSIDLAAGMLTDEQAAIMAALFMPWDATKFYADGARVRHRGLLYKCLMAHMSQADWMPSITPSLWKRMDDLAVVWPDWVRPTGAHDAYNQGDKVSYQGLCWSSKQDNNVWTPGDYGWEEA